MIKMCIVAEYMYCGGSEKSLLAFLNCLDRSVFDITLLLMKKKGDLLGLLPDDIKVEEIVIPSNETYDLLCGRKEAIKYAVRNGRFVFAIKKIIRSIKMSCQAHTPTERRVWFYNNIAEQVDSYPVGFDIVIDYMGYGLFNTFYAIKKVKGKVKFSWVHFEPQIAMPDFTAFRDILNEYNYIMCVSKNGMEQVCSMMPELSAKCRTFHNIVDEKDIKRMAEVERIEKKSTEGITILSVGRLDPPKGFDIGIGVIERLIKEGYAIKWKIIGEGWQRKELEERIAQTKEAFENIELLGQKINPYPYFEMCDIYMQPSRHEGYGIAVAEARAFDKPILVTDFAGAREQLVHGVTGIITECEEDAIYYSLKKMIDDKDLRQHLSENLKKEHGKIPPQLKWFFETIDKELSSAE